MFDVLQQHGKKKKDLLMNILLQFHVSALGRVRIFNSSQRFILELLSKVKSRLNVTFISFDIFLIHKIAFQEESIQRLYFCH